MDDLSRYPEELRGDSSIHALERKRYDEERGQMYRLRRLHLGLLAVALMAVVVLVIARGYSARGGGLIGITAAILVFRWWQLKKSGPAT
jgi:hypothetical protein